MQQYEQKIAEVSRRHIIEHGYTGKKETIKQSGQEYFKPMHIAGFQEKSKAAAYQNQQYSVQKNHNQSRLQRASLYFF